MNLFQTGNFKLHSGKTSNFKIECDALTDEDLETFAKLISEEFNFCATIGVICSRSMSRLDYSNISTMGEINDYYYYHNIFSYGRFFSSNLCI